MELTKLDKFESDIENDFEELTQIPDAQAEKKALQEAARNHVKRKKAITIRIQERDLEIMKLKSSKLGIPYQTYINMLIHKDARKSF